MSSPLNSAAIPPAPNRARCRQIAESDLPSLALLLALAFPHTGPDYWTAGFRRMVELNPPEGMPRFGHMLEHDGKPVGVLLLISSHRGGRIVANLSSWYVDPRFRSHSIMLMSVATKLDHVTYINISPAPHTWPVIDALGFVRYNEGRSALAAALGPGGGEVREIAAGEKSAETFPELGLLRAHAGYGCLSVTCEQDGRIMPFVFKPRRIQFPPVRMAELIYCRGMDEFTASAGALGRFLLRRGFLGIICDGRAPGIPSLYFPGKEPRYFNGPPPAPCDLAFTEKVIFEP